MRAQGLAQDSRSRGRNRAAWPRAPPRSARAAGRNTPAPRRRSPASRSGSTAPFPSRAPAGVLFRASGRRVASPDNAGGSGRAGSSASARRSPAARDWAHGRDRPAADRYRNAAAPASVVPGRLRAGCAARATDANSRAAPPPAGRRSSPSHGTGKLEVRVRLQRAQQLDQVMPDAGPRRLENPRVNRNPHVLPRHAPGPCRGRAGSARSVADSPRASRSSAIRRPVARPGTRPWLRSG